MLTRTLFCFAFVIVLWLSGTALAITAPSSVPDDDESTAARLDELATTLKAGVLSGVLSSEEAGTIYERVVEATKASTGLGRASGSSAKAAANPSDPKVQVLRLAAVPPLRIETLFEPEFLRRDLALLGDALDLDRTQLTITRVILDDYLTAFELAAAPLREGLTQYRRAILQTAISDALEEAGVRLDDAIDTARRADRAEAIARMEETLRGIDEKMAEASDADRKAYDAWRATALDATGDLANRLTRIRDRATQQLSALSTADDSVSASELLRLARQLRLDRNELRNGVIESIEAIANEAQRGHDNATLRRALALRRITLLVPRGRLGGERMDLQGALADASGRLDAPDAAAIRSFAEQWMTSHAPSLAEHFDARSVAMIDREIAGLVLQAARDAESIDQRTPDAASALRPYRDALRREVQASVVVRDALMASLTAGSRALREQFPDSESAESFASDWNVSALRRGFPTEMQTRWSERAVAAARALPALAPDTVASIAALDARTQEDLTELQQLAIVLRQQRDPDVARMLIDDEFGTDAKANSPWFDDRLWREVAGERFDVVDDIVEQTLQSLLTPAQFGTLPPRPRQWAPGKTANKGGGKSAGKGAAKGAGKGAKKGTNNP